MANRQAEYERRELSENGMGVAQVLLKAAKRNLLEAARVLRAMELHGAAERYEKLASGIQDF